MHVAHPFPDQPAPAGRTGMHVRQTLGMSAPIAAALLSEMGMGLISTFMLGSLGDQALAAGALSTNIFFTAILILQGMLSGVGVLAANRLGAGRGQDVPGLYWSGVLMAVLMAAPLVVALSAPAGAWRPPGWARIWPPMSPPTCTSCAGRCRPAWWASA